MMKLFMEGKDNSAVALAIAEMYGVSVDDVEEDVTAFAADLKEKGLL